ncbi:M15 family metallopeptidase [Paenibacillus herberti]|nr:M15 family metallopeptidase [Paenibacillus herberti]
MDKRLIWIAITALLTYGVLMGKPWETSGQPLTGANKSELQKRQTKVKQEQVHQGNLVLVNLDNPVSESVTKDNIMLAERFKKTTIAMADQDLRISERTAEPLLEMMEAARKDGVGDFIINSGYRTLAEQEKLYVEQGTELAMPAGRSEHNLGLSVDIGSLSGKMNVTKEGRWLQENAWKYGFILRYPEGKTDVTGIQYEPWHFRYVGLPHSAVMQQQDMVLEEYLDYLKQTKSIKTTVDGKTYQIEYYEVQVQTEIPLPINRSYELSGNNRDGIIVTISMEGGATR